jgi:hypothetical protein
MCFSLQWAAWSMEQISFTSQLVGSGLCFLRKAEAPGKDTGISRRQTRGLQESLVAEIIFRKHSDIPHCIDTRAIWSSKVLHQSTNSNNFCLEKI